VGSADLLYTSFSFHVTDLQYDASILVISQKPRAGRCRWMFWLPDVFDISAKKMNSNSSVSNGSASTANPDNKFVSDRLDPLLRKYATHLTATLSLVVGVTGVMMFYHLYKGKVQGLHEWFGMAFLCAFLLHIVRNRRQFLTLFKQNTMRVLLGAAAIVSLAFLLLAGPEKVSPSKGLAAALIRAPIARVAGALGVSVEQAVSRIVAAGGSNASADSTIETVATSAHVDAVKLLNAVLRPEAKN